MKELKYGNIGKIYLSIYLSILVVFLGGWTVPQNYYYFKDDSIIVYMPKTADKCFSLNDNGQPINITQNTIYGYYNNDTRIYFYPYTQAYYSGSGYNNVNITFDQETFETNLNLVESSTKQVNYDVIVSGLVSIIVFLQLISFNAFRVRRGSTKL